VRRNRLVLVVWILVALAVGFLAGRARITMEGEEMAEPQSTEEPTRKETDVSLSKPTPVVVRSIMPEYPENARREGIQGTVFVRVLVDTTGRVAEAGVFTSVHPALDSAAVAAARQWRFKPAEMRTRPVPQYVVIPVKFALEQ